MYLTRFLLARFSEREVAGGSCEVEREILELHQPADHACVGGEVYEAGACPTLLALASAWRGHPDHVWR